jgi:hypothetical protein
MMRRRRALAGAEDRMHRTPCTTARLAAVLIAAAGCQSPAPAPEAPPAPAATTASARTDAAAAAPAPAAEGDRFEPARGVVCQKSARVCEWRGGPSVGLTRIFFGDSAADALAPKMAPTFRYDPIFKPNPNQSCDTLVTTCYDRGGASAALTKQYFGAEAAKRLEARTSAVVRYGEWVTCDKTSNVCYDRLGAAVGVTRLYLGDAPSDALLGRLRAREG